MFKRLPVSGLVLIVACCIAASLSAPTAYAAGNRITAQVNESKLVQLNGSTHPMARLEFDQGSVADSLPMEHMFVLLRRSPEQESAVERLSAQQHDPQSANYRKWLSADQLGRLYGPSRDDINAVVSWLTSHGLRVNVVHKSGLVIDVSGNAAQVRDAFHTEIHNYNVHGERHIANSSDVQIPAALAPVVVGVTSLHNFFPKPLIRKPKANFTFPCNGCPDGFNGQVQYDEAPADFAKIYNVSPLYASGVTGKGQTVVVAEISDILNADVATFRSSFGLSSFSGTFSQIHPGTGCTDPGRNGEEGEAALDAEWAGAIAPDADVKLASCANTATNFGALIAAQNLLDETTPPPIMSLSFGGCEAAQGPGPEGNGFINALWQQADMEGVSVFVSTGDGAAAGCDDFNTSAFAIAGIAVNGLASTPHNFAAGGTDFADTANGTNAKFWKASNSASGESAKSYIPEMTWDDSCASSVLFHLFGFSNGVDFCNSSIGENFLDIVGASGGPSFVYAKPAWQLPVPGMPADKKRDLPDVSLFASNGFYNHAILFCMSDAPEGGTPCKYSTPIDAFFNSAGGTSFTAPQFASIQALINQKAGGRQGNPAPNYYMLAASEYGTIAHPNTAKLTACSSNKGANVGNGCLFHDVTLGSIDVPCFGTNNCYLPDPNGFGVLSVGDKSLSVAYPTRTGYDFATGLGTPNVTNVVNAWPSSLPTL